MRAAEVGRYLDGPGRVAPTGSAERGQSSADPAVVVADVDLLDAASPTEPSRQRQAWGALLPTTVLVLALSLLAMLLWPQPEAGPVDRPAAAVGGVESWPVRGDRAGDEQLARTAAAAWRAAGLRGEVPVPGPTVEPVYLAEPDGGVNVLLRSRDEDGRLLVAALAQRPGATPAVAGAQVVTGTPIALVVPAGDAVRLLLAPDRPDDERLLVRKRDSLWHDVYGDDQSLTPPVRGLSPRFPPLLGVAVRVEGVRGLREVHALDPGSLVPLPAPVEVVDPLWGRTGLPGPEDYDAALVALPAVPEPTRRVAVLAATRNGTGRVVLAEVRDPSDGQVRHHLVVSDGSGDAVLGPTPVVSSSLAAGVLPLAEGRLLVLAAAVPSLSRVEVRTSDGRSLIDGLGPASVVVPAPTPDGLLVLGKRLDGSVVASQRLAIAASDDAADNGAVVALGGESGGGR